MRRLLFAFGMVVIGVTVGVPTGGIVVLRHLESHPDQTSMWSMSHVDKPGAMLVGTVAVRRDGVCGVSSVHFGEVAMQRTMRRPDGFVERSIDWLCRQGFVTPRV